MSDSVQPQRRQPTRLPRPRESPGKNTGVGCHFLLQCMRVKSESEVAQSCPTLCDPMDCSLPGSSVHGIFQAIVLEWIAISFSRGISKLEWLCRVILNEDKRAGSLHIHDGAISENESEVAQSCLTPSNPMDCSLPGSSAHGIFQARILKWVAISSPGIISTQGSNPGLPHCRETLYHLSHQGSPKTLPSKIKIADGNIYSQDKLDLYFYFILESLYKKKSKIKKKKIKMMIN